MSQQRLLVLSIAGLWVMATLFLGIFSLAASVETHSVMIHCDWFHEFWIELVLFATIWMVATSTLVWWARTRKW